MLGTAIRKSNGVRSSSVTGTITSLSSIESRLGVVISNSVGVGVRRRLIRVSWLSVVGRSSVDNGDVIGWSSMDNRGVVDNWGMVDNGGMISWGSMVNWSSMDNRGMISRGMMDNRGGMVSSKMS